MFISLFRWDGFSPKVWVGFANYARVIFKDTIFRQALFNTIYIVLLSIPITIVSGVLLAAFLSSFKKGTQFYQTVNFLPYITTPVAIGFIFSFLFNWNSGYVNKALVSLGFIKEKVFGVLSDEPDSAVKNRRERRYFFGIFHACRIDRHASGVFRANRIKNAEFSLNGKTYMLDKNEGTNYVHGGFAGYNHRLWKGEAVQLPEGEGVKFTGLSPDGDQGFPGAGSKASREKAALSIKNRGALCLKHKISPMRLITKTSRTAF